MTSQEVQGGPAKKVVESTGNVVGPALPVEVVETGSRGIIAGPALQGVFVDETYIATNGLIGGPAMPIVLSTQDERTAGPAIAMRQLNKEEVIVWLLRDEFTTALPAGSVDGTAAEPGPGGNRVVVDTGSHYSISGGKLVSDGGASVHGDPGLWYDSLARIPGRTLFFTKNQSTLNFGSMGWGRAQSSYTTANGLYFFTNEIRVFGDNGATQTKIGNFTANIEYFLAITLRDTGAYSFIKDGAFTDWTLLYIDSTDSTATVYPALSNYNAAFLTEYARTPQNLLLPTPIAYDSFTRADGAMGNTETTGPDGQVTPSLPWQTTTGAIDTSEAKVTPVLGAELLTNGDFADWTGDDPDGWASIQESPPNREISQDGANSRAVVFNDGSGLVQARQTVLTVGKFYRSVIDIFSFTSGQIDFASIWILFSHTTSGVKTETWMADGTAFKFQRSANTVNCILDSISVKELDLSTCISAVSDSATRNVYAQVEITITDNTQAGLMIGLDSQITPANYLHIYCNRADGLIYIDSVTAGTVTNISSTVYTYSAGAVLAVRHDGTNVYVWYNNTYIVNSATAMPGAGTLTALFATDSATRFDNFQLMKTAGYTEFDEYTQD